MARNYVTSTTTLWADEDFIELTPQQQALYQMLKGQREISAAGTLPLRVRRWTRTAKGWTPDLIDAELTVLEALGHVAVDWDTEEVLIVKFVKFDGGYRNEKRRPVIDEAARDVMSPRLRGILASELDALNALHDTASALRGGNPSDRASDGECRSDRVVVTEGELDTATHIPQPTIPDPQPTEGEPFDDVEPFPWCSKHPGGTEEACGPCGTANRRNQVWHKARPERERRQRAARQALIDACPGCDENGMVLDLDTLKPLGKCDHHSATGGAA